MRVKNTSRVPVPLACGRVLARGEFAPADLLTDADEQHLAAGNLTKVSGDGDQSKRAANTRPAKKSETPEGKA